MTSKYILEKMNTVMRNYEILAQASSDYVNGRIDFNTLHEASELCTTGQKFSALGKQLQTASNQEKIHKATPTDRATIENLIKTSQSVQVLEILSNPKSSSEKKYSLCRTVKIGNMDTNVKSY